MHDVGGCRQVLWGGGSADGLLYLKIEFESTNLRIVILLEICYNIGVTLSISAKRG